MLNHPLFVNVGAGNIAQVDRVLAVIRPNSVTAKRYIKLAKESKKYIDATNKMPSRSVLLLDEGTVMISSVKPLTLLRRFRVDSMMEDDSDDHDADEDQSEEIEEEEEEDFDEDCGTVCEDFES